MAGAYTLSGPSAFEIGTAGFDGAQQNLRRDALTQQSLADSQAQEARAQTLDAQQQTLFDQGQVDRQTTLDAAAAEKAKHQAQMADFAALTDKVTAGTATSQDFIALQTKYPEMAAELKTAADGLSAEAKKAAVGQLYGVGSALKSGKPEVAIKQLEDYATAAENSGKKVEADQARVLAATIKADPAAGQATVGLLLQSLDDKAGATLFGAGDTVDDRYKVVDKQLVDLKAPGGPKPVALGDGTPVKKEFGDTLELQKVWNALPPVKSFQAQSDSYGRIVASAEDPSGAGDVSLVYAYMKMLDPGSVVREGEFATAEQTGGLPGRVVAMYNKAIDGERLTPEMRADFTDRASKIYKNAEGQYDGIRKQYEDIATRNGFDPRDALPDYRYSGKRIADPNAPAAGGNTTSSGVTWSVE